MKNAAILGSGSYGEVFLTYLIEQGYNIIGFFDIDKKKKGEIIHGVPVLGNFNDLLKNNYEKKIHQVFCPIGNNKTRTRYLRELQNKGFEIPNFIHSSVIINKDVKIGNGSYILPGVIVMPHTKVDDFVIISMGVKIAHHTVLQEGTFVATGANIGANVILKKRAFSGIGAIITTGVKIIGKDSIIGSGAVIIKDIPDYAVVVGNPGKIIKYTQNKAMADNLVMT
ncbi:NeuD/PglB/VioB family sugar acetyltransferase [uncultured Maribacter sp.]|uniref:NeuD/PglB/VioB family sugar acetyltransferase n=1 Tax=uncultured Maribacter sp. TaxID=431308 RepID=UPI0026026C27|nr:NeuD/PglB/VioB family sugar acetyltransferase [uncultured Maribacter sp.]